MDIAETETKEFYAGFFAGIAVTLIIAVIAALGSEWRDNYKAQQAKIDGTTIGVERMDGQPYPCSTTFEYLTCYYKNHEHYEVQEQNASERGGNVVFIQNHDCKLWVTIPQENQYDADRGYMHLRPAIDSYDCKQFGKIHLWHSEVDFPK